MQIRDIMTQPVCDISPEATLHEAAQTMKSADVGVLPVCRDDKLIGLITDRDITVRAVAEGRDPDATRVSEAMTPDLIFCYDDESVEAAAWLMEARQIRRLPIMDHRQHLVGMLSIGDIATRQPSDRLSSELLEQVSLARPSMADSLNLQIEPADGPPTLVHFRAPLH